METCEICNGEGYVDEVGVEPDDIRTVRCECNPKEEESEELENNENQNEKN